MAGEQTCNSQGLEVHSLTSSQRAKDRLAADSAKPLRVLLIGNYAPDRQESMRRFESLMNDGLTQAGHEVRVIRPPALIGRNSSGFQGVGKWFGYLDKYLLFPPMLRAAACRADVVHICDHSNAVYSRSAGATPCVVTCHDMLAVRGAMGEKTDCPASRMGRYLQRWIVRGMRRATVLVSDSSATLADVRRIVGGSTPEKKLILLSLSYPYRRLPREEAFERLRQLPDFDPHTPFILHVGSNLVRKNRPVVIRAFARAAAEFDLQLVLAGPPLSPELQDVVRSTGMAERIKVAVKPENELLEALYNLALVLLFPSRFEGFGWPLLEAQACGCPVLCSRCAPFAEVVGDSAMVHDSEDERGFAEDIVRLAKNAAERESWSALSLRNAARFDRAHMIRQYVDTYRECLRRP